MNCKELVVHFKKKTKFDCSSSFSLKQANKHCSSLASIVFSLSLSLSLFSQIIDILFEMSFL
jgi:hypothetical protein